jgi:hypothetical protein
MGASSGPGPWLSRTCEFVRDNDAEDVVLAAPTHPVAASSSGRLVFQVSQTCEPSKYRLTPHERPPTPRRIVTRNFETKAGRCKISSRFALKLPSASPARRGAEQFTSASASTSTLAKPEGIRSCGGSTCDYHAGSDSRASARGTFWRIGVRAARPRRRSGRHQARGEDLRAAVRWCQGCHGRPPRASRSPSR